MMNLSQEIKEKLMKIVMEEVSVAIEEGNSPFAAILVDSNVTIFDIKEKTSIELNIDIDVLKEDCQLQIEKARKTGK